MKRRSQKTGRPVSLQADLKLFNRSGQGAKLLYVPYQTDGGHQKTSGKSDFNERKTEPRFEQLCSHGNRVWVPIGFQRIHDSRKPESSQYSSLVMKKLNDWLEEWTRWRVVPYFLHQFYMWVLLSQFIPQNGSCTSQRECFFIFGTQHRCTHHYTAPEIIWIYNLMHIELLIDTCEQKRYTPESYMCQTIDFKHNRRKFWNILTFFWDDYRQSVCDYRNDFTKQLICKIQKEKH